MGDADFWQRDIERRDRTKMTVTEQVFDAVLAEADQVSITYGEVDLGNHQVSECVEEPQFLKGFKPHTWSGTISGKWYLGPYIGMPIEIVPYDDDDSYRIQMHITGIEYVDGGREVLINLGL